MKHTFTLFSTLLLATSLVSAAPNFDQEGYCTVDGLTTGGAGGQVVTPANLEELKKYAEDPTTPYIILIDKEINTGISCHIDSEGSVASSGTKTTYGDIIKIGSNKTLLGTNCKAMFNRVGINVQCQSNIIIRNITFTMKDVPISKTDENKIVAYVDGAEKTLNDPDCIAIQADAESVAKDDRISSHIWIDHCEFYNEDPDVMTDVDRYDGLVDTKNNSIYITISWCYFHDHHKSSLIGKGNSDNYNHKTTFHHNKFEKISSRLPLFRYGNGHLFNNYMVNCENGSNARINSDLYLEKNYYDNTKKPIFGKVSENGAATFVDNLFISCERLPAIIGKNDDGAKCSMLSSSEEVLEGTWVPSTEYTYTTDDVNDVPEITNNYSGVCKLSDSYIKEYIDENGSSSSYTAEIGDDDKQFAYANGNQIVAVMAQGMTYEISTVNGEIVANGTITSDNVTLYQASTKGIYLVKIGEKSCKVIVK